MTGRTLLLLALLPLAGCLSAAPAPGPAPVDPRATAETRALYAALHRLAPDHVLFGHQDDLAYGVHWWAEPGRSDVREAAGAYPAVYGWDLGHLELGRSANLDRVPFADMRRWIVEGYGRGGVNTVSWHPDNPVSGGNSWDTTRAVAAILPGGERHQLYRGWLDRLADFFLSLRAPGGELVPVVWRPFHEMTGSWFWWGGRNATPEEYRQLWRFTHDYLQNRRGVHNLLWAYAPDRFTSPEHYLERYPGDAYVDVLGYDDYHNVRTADTRPELLRSLRDVVQLAEGRGKLAAFTETGVETVPDSTWWTGTLLPALRDPVARRVAWVLVWRNANAAADRPNHFYAPFAGHPGAPDLARFRQDPLILFGDELPALYQNSDTDR